jgi:hypothetical protein
MNIATKYNIGDIVTGHNTDVLRRLYPDDPEYVTAPIVQIDIRVAHTYPGDPPSFWMCYKLKSKKPINGKRIFNFYESHLTLEEKQ